MDRPTDDNASKSGGSIGALLRASRIRSGEELPQVAETLRIRLCYLEAIEQGRFADLPGPAYTLGFVRTYANHFGLDTEEVIRRLRAETEIATTKPALVFPIPLSDSSVPSGAVIMIGLVAAVVSYGAYLAGSTRDGVPIARVSPIPERLARDAGIIGASPPAATAAALPASEPAQEPVRSEPASLSSVAATPQLIAPSIATTVLPPSAAAFGPATGTNVDATPAPARAPAQVAVAIPAPAEPPKLARIEVRAKADSWIQVREGVIGELLLTRLLREGETYAVPGRTGLMLLTGNAGALEIRVDGEAVPALGPEGAVRRSIALDAERLKRGTAASE